MYSILLGTHNIVRWLVLAAGTYAVLRSWVGWSRRKPWTSEDAGAVRGFVRVLELQFVLGIILYAISPVIRAGLANMGQAMRTPSVRYFVVEHALVMIVAVALAHVGAAKVRKAASDSAKFQAATIWMGITFAAVAGFIPWGRRLFPTF